jgi:hypothetical protein
MEQLNPFSSRDFKVGKHMVMPLKSSDFAEFWQNMEVA